MPVPDAEALRRAALQASWRRDRWVARRRVWLRWLLWVGGRYLIPALLVFGVGAWLWLGVLPGLSHPLNQSTLFQSPAASPAAAPLATPAEPVAHPASPQTETEPAGVTFSPEGEELHPPLPLRFEPRWAAAASNSSLSNPAASAPDTATPTPAHLKPENWLHSKEP